MKSYPVFVDKRNIDIKLDEEKDLRYHLIIPILHEEDLPAKSVLVILKNPSKATVNHERNIYESDETVNNILYYFFYKKYTKVGIVNLFAKFFTDSSNLNDYVDEAEKIIGSNNDEHIKNMVESKEFNDIVVAWGGYPQKSSSVMKKLYEERIYKFEKTIYGRNVYFVEKMVDGKFPLHGRVWKLNATMEKYDHQFYKKEESF